MPASDTIHSRRSLLTWSARASLAAALSPFLPRVLACDDKDCPSKQSNFVRATKIVTRRDIASMKADDEQLQMLRAAVKEMKHRSKINPLDPNGWLVQANAHSLFCATQDYALQVHYSWFFLPWHRAYMWNFENIMRHVINEPRLALPYWDWTKTPSIPSHYWDDADSLENVTRLMTRRDVLPADFVDCRAALRSRDFRQFGGYEKTEPPSLQIEGIAEQGIHNNVHNWVGGEMASFVGAGFDPMFTAHHGQIDRLWEAWLAVSPDHKNPVDEKFLNQMFHFTGPDGKEVKIKVSETLGTRGLGYEFDHLDFMYRLPGQAIGDESAVMSDAGDAWSVPVAIPKDERGPIVAALEQRQRVLLFFDRVQVPVHPFCVRVFFDLGEGKPFDLSSPNFAGTFTLLPVGSPDKGKTLEDRVSMQMEVHPQIADAIRAGRDVSVTFVPVRLRGRNEPNATLRLERVRMFVDDGKTDPRRV